MLVNQACEILDTGIASAEENMAFDSHLLYKLAQSKGKPVLHLYEWDSPSATYGHFIKPENFLNPHPIREGKLRLARRPTGGGILFHVSDYAFSFLVPASHPRYSTNTLTNYAFVNSMVLEAVQRFAGRKLSVGLLPLEPIPADETSGYFCMAKPTKFDVVIEGRKVGGAAQRRTKHGFLHQGTISLALPEEDYLQSLLLPGTRVFEAMCQYTYSLLSYPYTSQHLADAKLAIRHLLIDVLNRET
jgi:lipoate---protein ligase